MKIGLAQITGSSSYEENLEECLDYMLLGSKLEIDIICFPEMQFSTFFPSGKDYFFPFQMAVGIPGPTVERFQRTARELGMVVVMNYLERFNHEFYNASPVIDATGKLLGVSRMVHIPQIEGYYAQNYYSPGCGDFHVYHTQYGRIGVLISFDRHFPEASRALTLHDAEIILIPGHLTREQNLSVCRSELQTIAHQNSIFVGMCNRAAGKFDGNHIGNSLLASPDGTILGEGGREPGLVVFEIDLEDVNRERSKNPYLKLRRPDEYLHIIRQA
jgi:predicted amidohydrolase